MREEPARGPSSLPVGPLSELIRVACVLEASARKPGTVHPDAAFADACHADFVRSAEAAAPVLAEAGRLGVGAAVLHAVEATTAAVGGNTNLGILLLIAPLAAVPERTRLADGIGTILAGTTVEDARLAYQAIRLARPGGLGHAKQEDVAEEPTRPLVDVMRLAAGRDRIAAQYANGFEDVLVRGVGALLEWAERTAEGDAARELESCPGDPSDRERDVWRLPSWSVGPGLSEAAVIGLHLTLMAELPDTLIARKCGPDVANASARRARAVLDADWPETERGRRELERLDAWLRADGNRRNPGTTADLVAATLFAALRDAPSPAGFGSR